MLTGDHVVPMPEDRDQGTWTRGGVVAATVAALLLAALPARAETPLLSRRHWAGVCLASSAWFAAESWRAHDRAGDIADRIRAGDVPAQVAIWKAQRQRFDRRTVAMAGLTGGAVAAGVYLWRTQDPPELPDPQLGATLAQTHGIRLCLDGDAVGGQVRLRLSRSL